MNQNEFNRATRITKKTLAFIDKEIEEICKERSIETEKSDNNGFAKHELLLSLSKERRALIRLLGSSGTHNETEE